MKPNSDVKQTLERYNIVVQSSGKNVSAGWVGVNCPFCGDTGYHGGFNIKSPLWYNCWKCGHHKATEAFSLLANIPISEAKKILTERSFSEEKETDEKETIKLPFEFPLGCEAMTERHKKYLISRKYDPKYLEAKYSLLGTGPLSIYQFRIIIPIFFNREIVSYQARDITGKSKARYKACPKEREIIHHKNILYNIDNAKKKKIIIFEGVTSVWRWGDNTVATFGIQWTTRQAAHLLSYKTVIIFFDQDDRAREQSEKLANFLSTFGVRTIELSAIEFEDPAEMTKKDVQYWKRYFKI